MTLWEKKQKLNPRNKSGFNWSFISAPAFRQDLKKKKII